MKSFVSTIAALAIALFAVGCGGDAPTSTAPEATSTHDEEMNAGGMHEEEAAPAEGEEAAPAEGEEAAPAEGEKAAPAEGEKAAE